MDGWMDGDLPGGKGPRGVFLDLLGLDILSMHKGTAVGDPPL